MRKENGVRTYRRIDCNTWGCARCGRRKAAQYKKAIQRNAQAVGLRRFVTLTLDPRKIKEDPLKWLNRAWAEMRTYLKRKIGKRVSFIRVLEFHKSGVPHLHVLVSHYLPQGWLSMAWQAVGGGRMVDIRMVDMHRVARYLSKYLTKELLQAEGAGRARRVTTSRDIKLLEKPEKTGEWKLCKLGVWTVAVTAFSLLRAVEVDKNGDLLIVQVAEENE